MIILGQSKLIAVTSSATMSISLSSIVLTLGIVRPKSPCTNSFTYVPACVVKYSLNKFSFPENKFPKVSELHHIL